MDTALPQKFPFILDRNLVKANCTENRVCTSCYTVVLEFTTSNTDKYSTFQRLPTFLAMSCCALRASKSTAGGSGAGIATSMGGSGLGGSGVGGSTPPLVCGGVTALGTTGRGVEL